MRAAAFFAEARARNLAALRASRVGADGSDPPPPLFSPPNAITLGGYAAGIAWAAGGGPMLAVVSVLADEFDGLSARNLGLASPVGDRLDWGADICMLAIVGAKVGLGWIALPAALFVQVVLKERGIAPPIGSTRAALMGYAMMM